MNEHIGIGRLTRDPEMRYSTKGMAICEFSIAINEKRGGEEEVEYIDYVAFDKQAETTAEYARKGRLICVTSSYHTERWKDKTTNENRSRVRMRARHVEFLDKPPESQGRPQQQEQSDDSYPEDIAF